MKTSLVISTYNKPNYLELCIQSALNQIVAPDEILIADDGSTKETAELIKKYAEQSNNPLIHVWQEDNGFRKCAIMNKAFARCTGEYIIQSDGDIIFDKHFVQDHMNLAEHGYFVCGSRVYLTPEGTQRMFADKSIRPKLKYMQSSHILNSIRLTPLQKYYSLRYGKRIDQLRGCNMFLDQGLRLRNGNHVPLQGLREIPVFDLRRHLQGDLHIHHPDRVYRVLPEPRDPDTGQRTAAVVDIAPLRPGLRLLELQVLDARRSQIRLHRFIIFRGGARPGTLNSPAAAPANWRIIK